jgi:uncharacterized membrane protein
MEALTDGIFAIAMTLLVLELKAPDLPKNVANAQLLEHLGHQMPAFFGFLVHSCIAVLCGFCPQRKWLRRIMKVPAPVQQSF